MGHYVASQLVKAMIKKRIQIADARVLVLGLSFKENCPDIRNTRVVDVVHELKDHGMQVDVHDPWVDVEEAKNVYNLTLTPRPPHAHYDAIVIAVAHSEFRDLGFSGVAAFGSSN